MLFVTWLGGFGGRYRDKARRHHGDLKMHALDELGLLSKLADLAEVWRHDKVGVLWWQACLPPQRSQLVPARQTTSGRP